MAQMMRCERLSRDYFVVKASARAVNSALNQADMSRARADALVLELAGTDYSDFIYLHGRLLGVVPFPYATLCLANLALDAALVAGEPEHVELYVPRAVFDQIADLHGLDRIGHLDLRSGAAAGDLTLHHLAACLRARPERIESERIEVGRSKSAPIKDGRSTFEDQIVLALHTHLARLFGGMTRPADAAGGGLAPWQLRLARHGIDSHLDEEVPLADLARDCGLSVSHFARGFARSTGLPPHRWLMQRRVVVATELIRQAHLSLAEIALTCGFADQSHFTRVFAAATGLAPGKWRGENAKAIQQDKTPDRHSARMGNQLDRQVQMRSCSPLFVNP